MISIAVEMNEAKFTLKNKIVVYFKYIYTHNKNASNNALIRSD